MTDKTQKYKWNIIALVVFVCLAVGGCGQKENNVRVYEDEQIAVSVEHEELTVTAFIDKIDAETGVIDFVDCMTGVTYSLGYHGGVDITNSHGNAMNIEQLQCGEIMDVTYYSDTKKLTKLQQSSKAVRRTGVTKLAISADGTSAVYKGTKCSVSEYARAYDGDKEIDMLEVNTEDEVTLNLYGDKLMSVVVTKGHGYVRLKNQDTYVGGMVEIGHGVIVPVTPDMLVAVGEGTYTLTLSRNGYTGSKENVVVTKGKETEVDVYDIAIPRGTIICEITPAEADLYVNNVRQTEHAYSGYYGSYMIKVMASGYNTYVRRVTLEDTVKTYKIELAQKSESTTEDGTTEDNTTDSDTATSTTEVPITEKVATNNTITISSPEGVGVYVDGEYVGMSPVTFGKTVGTHTVTLYKSGYLIKSYTIQSLDDGNNDTYTLADLVPITGDTEIIE